jgi:hypothetical protein
MKRTEVEPRRMKIITRKMVGWGGGEKTKVETINMIDGMNEWV